MGKQNLVYLSIALDYYIELVGQGINHRHTHTMQTTRELVVVIGELAARMQGRQNDFHTGQALLWVNIYWHSAAIVAHRQRPILV